MEHRDEAGHLEHDGQDGQVSSIQLGVEKPMASLNPS
jgi:hypothetical protein